MASTGDDDSETDSTSEESSSSPSSSALGASDNDPSESAGPVSQGSQSRREAPAVSEEADGREDEDGDEDEDQSEDENLRENRFEGPSSTWRFFTEEERALAASLDQQRANDLSIHLYNAHALKIRVRDPNAATTAKPHQSKKRWIKRNEDGSLPWHPDAAWTAWPLPPEDVPRSREQFSVSVLDSDEEWTFRKKVAWRPSSNLEDEVLAIMLRKAKERFRERTWMHSSSGQSMKVLKASVQSKGKHRQVSGSNPDDDVSMRDNDAKTESSNGDEEIVEMPDPEIVEPAILADDEQASAILQPTIRHVISKLDDLLTRLHKSRQGHTRNSSNQRAIRRRSRTTSKARSASSKAKTASRSTSAVRSRTQSSVSSFEPGSDTSENASSNDGSPEERGTDGEAEESKKPKRTRPLNPRDWSEVLGMASIVGWSPEVVDRAARRCASLFNENMDFANIGSSTANGNVPYSADAEPAKQTKSDLEDFIVQSESDVKWHYCPVSTCNRHTKPYSKAWRWREHLKRSHKYNNAQVDRAEKSLHPQDHQLEDAAAMDENGHDRDRPKHRHVSEMGEGGIGDTTHRNGSLQPINVKMGRGRDIRPRKRKAPRKREIESESDSESSE